jgi:hypothetical protein
MQKFLGKAKSLAVHTAAAAMIAAILGAAGAILCATIAGPITYALFSFTDRNVSFLDVEINALLTGGAVGIAMGFLRDFVD